MRFVADLVKVLLESPCSSYPFLQGIGQCWPTGSTLRVDLRSLATCDEVKVM
jgi:hypothetical protein